jgi:hypothetical protein
MEGYKEAVSKAGLAWPPAKRQEGSTSSVSKPAEQEAEQQPRRTGRGRQAKKGASKQQQEQQEDAGPEVCAGADRYSYPTQTAATASTSHMTRTAQCLGPYVIAADLTQISTGVPFHGTCC